MTPIAILSSPVFMRETVKLAVKVDRWTTELRMILGCTEEEARSWLSLVSEIAGHSSVETMDTLYPVFRNHLASGAEPSAAAGRIGTLVDQGRWTLAAFGLQSGR